MASKPNLLQLTARYYRHHAWIFGIAALLALTQMFLFGSLVLFWPLMVWTGIFAVHFLIYRSLDVSSDWVSERTTKAALKAYDVSHIESIREQYEATAERHKPKSPSDEQRLGAGGPESQDTSLETDETLRTRR